MNFLKKYGLLIIPAYMVLMDILSIPNLIQVPEFLLPILLGDLQMAAAIFLSISVRKKNKRMPGFVYTTIGLAVCSIIVSQITDITRGHFYVSPIELIAVACIVVTLIPALKNKQQEKAIVTQPEKQQTSVTETKEAEKKAVSTPPAAPVAVAEVANAKVKGNIVYGPLESSGLDNTTITVTDIGFHFAGKAMRTDHAFKKEVLDTFVEYTQCTKVTNVMGTYAITANGYEHSFVPDKESKVAIEYIKQQIAAIEFERMHKEHILRCNVCGQIYAYTFAQVEEKVKAMQSAARNQAIGAMNTLFTSQLLGSIQSGNAGAQFNDVKEQLDSLTKCPNCRSGNATEITAEEAAAAKNASASAAAPASSAMDELKKLKELLDMGIVTQEEFDAKKKQLLGL